MDEDALIEAFISEAIALDIVNIEQVTIDKMQDIIKKSTQENLSPADTLLSIANLFNDFAENRAPTIARTEVGTAASFGQMVSAVMAGATQKIWLSSGDSHVRGSHAAMGGQTAPIDGTFSNGARFPLDPTLSAGERINCRCAMSFR